MLKYFTGVYGLIQNENDDFCVNINGTNTSQFLNDYYMMSCPFVKMNVIDCELITNNIYAFIEDAVKEAFTRPILTQEQAKEWNPNLENQFAK